MNALMQMVQDMLDHRCPVKRFLCKDDPKNLVIGFACYCGAEFSGKWGTFTSAYSDPNTPDYIKDGLNTQEGRIDLAKMLTGPVMIVWDERLEL